MCVIFLVPSVCICLKGNPVLACPLNSHLVIIYDIDRFYRSYSVFFMENDVTVQCNEIQWVKSSGLRLDTHCARFLGCQIERTDQKEPESSRNMQHVVCSIRLCIARIPTLNLIVVLHLQERDHRPEFYTSKWLVLNISWSHVGHVSQQVIHWNLYSRLLTVIN